MCFENVIEFCYLHFPLNGIEKHLTWLPASHWQLQKLCMDVFWKCHWVLLLVRCWSLWCELIFCIALFLTIVCVWNHSWVDTRFRTSPSCLPCPRFAPTSRPRGGYPTSTRFTSLPTGRPSPKPHPRGCHTASTSLQLGWGHVQGISKRIEAWVSRCTPCKVTVGIC